MSVANYRKIELDQSSSITCMVKAKLQAWVQQHLIENEPFDYEVWDRALLNTPQVTNLRPLPRELR